MGFDLLRRLRSLFKFWGSSSEKNSQDKLDNQTTNTTVPVGKRKRKFDNKLENSTIKYRRMMPLDNDCDDPTGQRLNSTKIPESNRLSVNTNNDKVFQNQLRRSIFDTPPTKVHRVRIRNVVNIDIDQTEDTSNDENDIFRSSDRLDALRLGNTNGGYPSENSGRPMAVPEVRINRLRHGHNNWYNMATDNVLKYKVQQEDRKQYIKYINQLSINCHQSLERQRQTQPQPPSSRRTIIPTIPPPLQRIKPYNHCGGHTTDARESEKLVKSATTTTSAELKIAPMRGSSSLLRPSLLQSSTDGQRAMTPRNKLFLNEVSDVITLDDDEKTIEIDAQLPKQPATVKHSTQKDLPKDLTDASSSHYLSGTEALQRRIDASTFCADNFISMFNSKYERWHKEINMATLKAKKLTDERQAYEQSLRKNWLTNRNYHRKPLVAVDTVQKKSEVDDEETLLPPLTDEQLNRYRQLIKGPDNMVLVSKFNLNLTRSDIRTLVGNRWLNDEIINFYMNLLTDRSEIRKNSLPSVYAMNTFFVPRLLQNGHGGVKRWTRKVNIFDKDIIPIPVHVGGVHWCMAIIHMKNKTISYYDSMGNPNPVVLDALARYLREESLDKRKETFDTSVFTIESVRNVPHQKNGSDCGVFSCMIAEYITRNKPLSFGQQNMEYFRKKMTLEICDGELWL